MKIKIPNKSTLLYAALLAACLLGCTLQSISLAQTQKLLHRMEDNKNADSAVISVSAPMLAKDALFYLKECGGKIGIFDAKTEILIDIIDVFSVSLPTADRQALGQGIPIYSFTELASVIEDLST